MRLIELSDKSLSYLKLLMHFYIGLHILSYLGPATETNSLFKQNFRSWENVTRNLTFVCQLFDLLLNFKK